MYGPPEVSGEISMSRRPSEVSTATGGTGLQSLSTCPASSRSSQAENGCAAEHGCEWEEWFLEMPLSSGKLELGVSMRPTRRGSALAVTGVAPNGQVEAWNAQHGLLHIRPGDVVLEVNGISGNSAEMLRELAPSSKRRSLALLLTRAVCFRALVNQSRPGYDLTTVAKKANEDYPHPPVIVTKVSSAVLEAFHLKSMPPELLIWPGDRVIMVNGRTCREDIQRQLGTVAQLEVKVRRPSPGTFEAYGAAFQAQQITSAAPCMFKAFSSAIGKAKGSVSSRNEGGVRSAEAEPFLAQSLVKGSGAMNRLYEQDQHL